jgi:hypothetical protein
MNPIDNGTSIRRGAHMAAEREYTAHMAHHLSHMAIRQWEKTLTGMVALPAAAALGVAACTTFCVALIERTFEVIESALGEVGRAVVSHREEVPRHEARA